MTTDLTYLGYTAMLTAVLWIPYVVAQVATNGFLTSGNYRDPTPRPVPFWASARIAPISMLSRRLRRSRLWS
jgi:hypothetical protein